MVQTILRRPDVERLTGLRRSSLYALMAAGKFPRPITLSEKSVGWLEPEIAEWQKVPNRRARRCAKQKGAPPQERAMSQIGENAYFWKQSRVLLCRGHRDLLAAMRAIGYPAWAALSTSGLGTLDLPKETMPGRIWIR